MDQSPNAPSCPRCHVPVAADAPEGLCPRCLMELSLAAPTEMAGEMGPGGTKVVTPEAKAPPPVEEIARLFPQLEILACLGRGGMGIVYKARQPKLNRLVALKILTREKEKDPHFAERFEREARALARLNHPSIVAVYDFGEANGLWFLVMEFVDGMNLRQLLRARKMTPEEALGIVPRICEALQYAHEQGIVHRDVKPENILLDKQGRVKIADFGIAKILGGEKKEEALTGEHQTMGTPHYMAPEQVEKPATVDHRADIYSLGVVFYEMLTGELPLGKFAAPSKKVQVDVRLDEVVLHALEKEPERRYQKASQVKSDVETIATTPPAQAGAKAGAAAPPTLPPQTPAPALAAKLPEMKPARHSRTAIVGAAWMPFLLVAALAAGMYYWPTARETYPQAMAPMIQNGVMVWPSDHAASARLYSWLIVVALLPFVLLGITAPFGTTILGWIAIGQIRRSAGRIYGLGLAVFDALVFPLVVLDAVLALLFIVWHESDRALFRNSDAGTLLLFGMLATIAWLDVWIVRKVWRTVNKPLDGTEPAGTPEKFASPRTPGGGGWKPVLLLILGVLLAAYAVTGIRSHYDNAITAEVRYRVFEADDAVLKEFLPEFPSAYQRPNYSTIMISEETLSRMVRAVPPERRMVDRQRVISSWPSVADGWSWSGLADRNNSPAILSCSGSGFLGVRKQKDRLQVRVDYQVSYVDGGGDGTQHIRETYAPLLADLDNVLVFVLPVQDSGYSRYVIYALEVSATDMANRPTGLNGFETNNLGAVVSVWNSTTHFAIFYQGNDAGDMSYDGSSAWREFGTLRLPGGKTVPYECNSLSPQQLLIGAEGFDLRDGRVVVLKEDGSVHQVTLWPGEVNMESLSGLAREIREAPLVNPSRGGEALGAALLSPPPQDAVSVQTNSTIVLLEQGTAPLTYKWMRNTNEDAAAVTNVEDENARRAAHENFVARLNAAAGIAAFTGRDAAMAGLAGDAAAAGDAEMAKEALGRISAFTTRDAAAAKVVHEFMKSDQRSEALKVGSTISAFTTRDSTLAEVATESASAGDAKTAKGALGRISAYTLRDNAAYESARLLAKAGLRTDALEVARSISAYTTRDAALLELSK